MSVSSDRVGRTTYLDAEAVRKESGTHVGAASSHVGHVASAVGRHAPGKRHPQETGGLYVPGKRYATDTNSRPTTVTRTNIGTPVCEANGDVDRTAENNCTQS